MFGIILIMAMSGIGPNRCKKIMSVAQGQECETCKLSACATRVALTPGYSKPTEGGTGCTDVSYEFVKNMHTTHVQKEHTCTKNTNV